MGERVEHRLLGDGVEDDALDVDALQRVALLQHVAHMPGDRFALAIRVGGEIEMLGAFDRLGDVVQPLLRLAVDLPGHGEVFVRPHRAVLGRQIAHMAVGGQHGVAFAEIFVDGLGLGRQLNDDDVHSR